jgi:hypothetical protein
MRQPFAQIAFIDLCSPGKLDRRHRSVGVDGPVKTQRIAEADHGDAGCAAKIRQHLADECVELAFIDSRGGHVRTSSMVTD